MTRHASPAVLNNTNSASQGCYGVCGNQLPRITLSISFWILFYFFLRCLSPIPFLSPNPLRYPSLPSSIWFPKLCLCFAICIHIHQLLDEAFLMMAVLASHLLAPRCLSSVTHTFTVIVLASSHWLATPTSSVPTLQSTSCRKEKL